MSEEDNCNCCSVTSIVICILSIMAVIIGIIMMCAAGTTNPIIAEIGYLMSVNGAAATIIMIFVIHCIARNWYNMCN